MSEEQPEKLDYFEPGFIVAFVMATMADFTILFLLGGLIPGIGLMFIAIYMMAHYFTGAILIPLVLLRMKHFLPKLVLGIVIALPFPFLAIGIFVAIILQNRLVEGLAIQAGILAVGVATGGVGAVAGEAAAIGAEGAEAAAVGAEVAAAGAEATAGAAAEATAAAGEAGATAAAAAGARAAEGGIETMEGLAKEAEGVSITKPTPKPEEAPEKTFREKAKEKIKEKLKEEAKEKAEQFLRGKEEENDSNQVNIDDEMNEVNLKNEP